MEKAYIEQNYPLLSRIDSPADLRKLSVEMLPAVCSELRRFLIESLSTNPGHFASSMGSVDFTVALHYVFDTPNDRIVWDVGHQAYGHKILTGRRDVFENNRKYNGLSGFPNPKESEYDSFIAGHASNSISAALGMSMAAELQGVEHRNVVAVIGDASISGGLAFEAMNNASINRNNLIILLNDNDMAIDQNVGAIGEYMSHLNTSRRYNNFKFKVYRFCLRHKIINEKSRGLILRFSNSLKALLTNQQNLFEGLNIRYFGPFDGHDVKKLVSIFTELKNLKGPRIIHLRTRKGKGYCHRQDIGRFRLEQHTEVSRCVRQDPCGTCQDRRKDSGHHGSHAYGLLHDIYARGIPQASIRCGYSRRACSDILSRTCQGRHEALLLHLLIVLATSLR